MHNLITLLWLFEVSNFKTMNDIPEWIHFDIIHPDHVKLCSSSSNSPPLFASVGGRVSSARRTFQLCEAWPQSATSLQSVLHQLQSRQARNLQLSLSTTWVVIHEFTSLPSEACDEEGLK